MFSLFGLVGHVMEDLVGHDRRDRTANLVVPGDVGTTLTLKKRIAFQIRRNMMVLSNHNVSLLPQDRVG